jgi:sodium-independent sulfate anion transporter 11
VLALAVGIWSIVFGVLNLGFIFDFIAFPIVLGFVAGLSQVVILTQVPAILGLVGVGPDALSIMGQIISKITETKPVTVGMSVASLLLLGGLSFVGRKWGANNQSIRILSTSRNIIVIGLMTLISYILNKNLEVPLWSVTEPTSTTIPAPKVPLMALFNELFLPSGTIFLGMALEHVALTKFMGHKNGYNINASQELVSLGVTNIANSVMGGFPVGGGDMARASVNSFSGVKSPLGGLISSSIVLASMFALSDFIKFIPQFTIAAVIMVATVENMPPMAYIGKFWKLSFLDFVGFLISFNVTLVRDATEGIVIALIVMMVSTVGRAMFSWSRTITRRDVEQQYLSELNKVWATADRLIIPPGTQVIGIERELLYLNASRMKRHILDTVFTHNSGKPMGIFKDPTRSWDYRREKHIAALRRKAGLGGADTYSPHLRILVLDFTNTPFIDSTAVQVLEEIKTELREYGGDVVNFRFVGLNAAVRKRFQRAGWPLQNYRDADKSTSENRVETKEVDEDREVLVEKADVLKAEVVKDLVFEILPTAILYQSQARISDSSHAEDLILQKQI